MEMLDFTNLSNTRVLEIHILGELRPIQVHSRGKILEHHGEELLVGSTDADITNFGGHCAELLSLLRRAGQSRMEALWSENN